MNAQNKKRPVRPKIANRRARFDYELGDSLVVGIALTGVETKALRQGRGQLQGSYVNIIGDELYLVGAKVFGTVTGPIDEQTQIRSRKLLAKRKEIDKLIAGKQQGLTIVPTDLITSSRYIKLRISLARGKKRYDKRQVIKKRDEERTARRDI